MAVLEFAHVNAAIDFMNFSHRTVALGDLALDVRFSRIGGTAVPYHRTTRDSRSGPDHRGNSKKRTSRAPRRTNRPEK